MKIKKILALFVLILALSVISAMSANGAVNITVSENSNICKVMGKNIEISTIPFMFRGEIYLPIDDIMPLCGVSMGWDGEQGEVVCQRNGNEYRVKTYSNVIKVNGEEKTMALYPVMYEGVMCVGEKLIREVADASVTVEKEITTEYKEYVFTGGSEEWDINGKTEKLKEQPFLFGGELYFSVDEILPQLGYNLGWQDDISAVICIKDGYVDYIISQKNNIWINENEYIFNAPSLIRDNKLYISASMLEKLENANVLWNGEFESMLRRDLLETTFVNGNFRLPGNSVSHSGGVTVVDGFGMEMLSITPTSAQNYAGVVNALAEYLPGVQVYNIAVPTAAEFYAPNRMKVDQTSGIKTIYKNLSPSVIPVNAVKVLQEHADEHIYFKTDHHWTQRGAYYVYRELMDIKGKQIPDITEFENNVGSGFIGSFSGFAGNSVAGNIIRANPEKVERFIPKYATVGTVYEDMYMTKTQRFVDAVSTKTASYLSFIGGDGPVTAFFTDAPSDEVAVIIKESYGNAFATWVLNDYKAVYVIDPRKFNGFGNKFFNRFNIKTFCDNVGCTDLIIINYPGGISSGGIRQAILDMTK